MALTLAGLAKVARVRGRMFRAARLLRIAEWLLTSVLAMYGVNFTVTIAYRMEWEQLVRAEQAQIPDTLLSEISIDNQALTLERALALAVEGDEHAQS